MERDKRERGREGERQERERGREGADFSQDCMQAVGLCQIRILRIRESKFLANFDNRGRNQLYFDYVNRIPIVVNAI